jgi:hypothetical protein
MKKFRNLLTGLVESDAAYGASLKKIAHDEKIKSLSKRDRETLMRIADMMKNANRDDIKHEETELNEMTQRFIFDTLKSATKAEKMASRFNLDVDSGVGKDSDGKLFYVAVTGKFTDITKWMKMLDEGTLIEGGDCYHCDGKDDDCKHCGGSGYVQFKDDDRDSSITSKDIKMAIGIANDPRYKDGNYSAAYSKISKLKKGLVSHPRVKDALRQANESVVEGDTGAFANVKRIAKELQKESPNRYSPLQMAKAKKEREERRKKSGDSERNRYQRLKQRAYGNYMGGLKDDFAYIEATLEENYRTLATKGMGTETPSSANNIKKNDIEMDYYDASGSKRRGKISNIDNETYTVRDIDGKYRKYKFLDREKAKEYLKKESINEKDVSAKLPFDGQFDASLQGDLEDKFGITIDDYDEDEGLVSVTGSKAQIKKWLSDKSDIGFGYDSNQADKALKDAGVDNDSKLPDGVTLDDIKKKYAKEIIGFQDDGKNLSQAATDALYAYQGSDAIKTDDSDEFDDFVMGLQMSKYREALGLKEASAKADAMRAIKRDKDFKQVKDVDVRATTADMKLAKKNPIVQLRKILDYKGGTMEFLNNKKLKIKSDEADALLRGFDSLQKVQDKEKYQLLISKDPASLKKILKIVKR